jgi:hypothetical protein
LSSLYVCVLIKLFIISSMQPLSDKKHFDKEEHNADYGM